MSTLNPRKKGLKRDMSGVNRHSYRHAPRGTRKRNLRSKFWWFTEFCNSHYVSHFAAFFIVARAKISIAESCFCFVVIKTVLCFLASKTIHFRFQKESSWFKKWCVGWLSDYPSFPFPWASQAWQSGRKTGDHNEVCIITTQVHKGVRYSSSFTQSSHMKEGRSLVW